MLDDTVVCLFITHIFIKHMFGFSPMIPYDTVSLADHSTVHFTMSQHIMICYVSLSNRHYISLHCIILLER